MYREYIIIESSSPSFLPGIPTVQQRSQRQRHEVLLMSLKLLLKDELPSVMTKVLRMERLVKEGRRGGTS